VATYWNKEQAEVLRWLALAGEAAAPVSARVKPSKPRSRPALHLRRFMGEVLMRDETPRRIWDQREEILDAVIRGDGPRAEQLARVQVGPSN